MNVGELIALSTDVDQAEVLNTVGRYLRRSCRDSLHMDLQCGRIVDKLDLDGKQFIKHLYEFISSDENK